MGYVDLLSLAVCLLVFCLAKMADYKKTEVKEIKIDENIDDSG